jgi:hypothetical protein
MSEEEDVFENDEEIDREAAEEFERARQRRSTTGVRLKFCLLCIN